LGKESLDSRKVNYWPVQQKLSPDFVAVWSFSYLGDPFYLQTKKTSQGDRQFTADPELFFSLFQGVGGFYVCTC
jgi:hypothetical protein